MTDNTAPRLEALLRLGGELPFTVNVSKPQDDRRNRIYGRSVSASLHIAFENAADRAALPSPRRIAVLTRRLLAERGCVAHADASKASIVLGAQFKGFDASDGYWSWSPAFLAFTAELRAQKPSEIPAEDDMREWMRETVVPVLSEAFLLVVEETRETERRKKAVKQANHIGAWAASTLTERAKGVVRYDQRLAALKAEMEAELKVQAEAMREEEVIEKALDRTRIESGGETVFEPEAIAHAIEHFEELAGGWRGGLFHRPEWSEEHVFPSPKTEEKAS